MEHPFGQFSCRLCVPSQSLSQAGGKSEKSEGGRVALLVRKIAVNGIKILIKTLFLQNMCLSLWENGLQVCYTIFLRKVRIYFWENQNSSIGF